MLDEEMNPIKRAALKAWCDGYNAGYQNALENVYFASRSGVLMTTPSGEWKRPALPRVMGARAIRFDRAKSCIRKGRKRMLFMACSFENKLASPGNTGELSGSYTENRKIGYFACR